jgi:hypothetical protein
MLRLDFCSMKRNPLIYFLLVVIVLFGGCKSLKWDSSGPLNKADELKRNGVASDMAEAQRMADDRNWIENAQRKEELERQKRAEAAQKK